MRGCSRVGAVVIPVGSLAACAQQVGGAHETKAKDGAEADSFADPDSGEPPAGSIESGWYETVAFTRMSVSWVIAVGPDQSLTTWGDPSLGASWVGLPSYFHVTLFSDAWDGSLADYANYCDVFVDLTGTTRDAVVVAGQYWSSVLPADAVVWADTCGFSRTGDEGYLDARFGGATTIGIGPYDQEARDLLGTDATVNGAGYVGGYYNLESYSLPYGSKAVAGVAQALDGSGNVLYDVSGAPVFLPPERVQSPTGVLPGLYTSEWLYVWTVAR